MSKLEKILNAVGLEVEWEEDEENNTESVTEITERQPKVRAAKKMPDGESKMQSIVKSATSELVVLEPLKISDARKICDELKNGKTIVVNVEKLKDDDIVRLYDFISGSVYALDGKLKEISENVLVIAPHGVDIQTDEIETKPDYGDDDYGYDYEE